MQTFLFYYAFGKTQRQQLNGIFVIKRVPLHKNEHKKMHKKMHILNGNFVHSAISALCFLFSFNLIMEMTQRR